MRSAFPTAVVDFTSCDGLGINKGADWMITLSVYDRDLYQTETPYFLDGFQGKGQIKKSVNDEVIADIDVLIDGNTITLSIPHERTSAIPTSGDQFYKVEKYFYDVIISNEEETLRLLQGTVEVSPQITKEETNVSL